MAPLEVTDEGTTSPTAEPDAGRRPRRATRPRWRPRPPTSPSEQARGWSSKEAVGRGRGEAAADAADEIFDEAGEGTALADTSTTPPGRSCGARPRGPPCLPPLDSYSLRLVAGRRLYDLGVEVQHSPALAVLAQEAEVRLHPHDFDRLGISAGARVSLTSARGAITLAARPEPGVARGSAAVVLNQPGPTVTDLIDAAASVTEVRVERA
jgi:anaerobic selenocysteine-containing dehydrogenase